MTRCLVLVVLVLVLAWTAVIGPGGAAAGVERHAAPASELPQPLFGMRPNRTHGGQARATRLGARAARYARGLLGVPYSYGGESPRSGFDCSGLVRYVFGHFGLDLPHSSYADFRLGRRVARRSLRPGDLVFFDGVGHVGLYVGSNRFIHAPHSGTTVRITSLNDPWYRSRYEGARRVVRSVANRA